MAYFLLAYDQSTGDLLELKEFQEKDRHVAEKERFERELGEVGDHVEVVLLGAESREALQRTHARYFKTVSELAASGGFRALG